MLILSDKAKDRISQLLQEESGFFRVEVIGGGCSGFQYKFSFDQREKDDLVIEKIVIIDQESANLLAKSKLDYVETLASAQFIIENPDAKAKCGCGTSFSL